MTDLTEKIDLTNTIVNRLGGIFGNHQAGSVYDKDSLCPTLTATRGGYIEPMIVEDTVKIRQATKKGYIECKVGGVADLSYPSSKLRRGRVQSGGDICPTLLAGGRDVCRIESAEEVDVNNYRLRRLTPKECWRLMGFSDEDFEKAAVVNSNTQLYKQAGNSIVVDVLVEIFRNLLYEDKEKWLDDLLS